MKLKTLTLLAGALLVSIAPTAVLAAGKTIAVSWKTFQEERWKTDEAAIKAVWARLEAAGVPSLATRTHRRHRPHISLSVAERIKTGQLEDARKRLAATHLDVTLYSPAVFPRRGVLYLSVVPTLALLRLHENVHAALRDSVVARAPLKVRGGLSGTQRPPKSPRALTCFTTSRPSPPTSAVRAFSTPRRAKYSRSRRCGRIDSGAFLRGRCSAA